MNIEYLFYFADIAKTKSITKSATNNNISQQGLSRIVKVLEEHYKVKLLVNYGNRIDLTPAGYELAEYIREIQEKYDEAEAVVTRANTMPEVGQLLTLYMTNLASYLMVPMLDAITDSFPNLIFQEKTQWEILEEYEKDPDAKDCLFFISVPRKSTIAKEIVKCGYGFDPCFTTETMIMTSKNAPWAGKEIITDEDLLNLPLIYANAETMWELALKDMTSKRLLNYPFACTNNQQFIVHGVETGKAVAFCTSLCSRLGQNNVIAIPLQNPYIVDYGILYAPARPYRGQQRALISEIKQMCQKIKYLEW